VARPIAKRVPVDAVLFHNWRNRMEYAGGIIADQGAHVFDGSDLLMGASFPVAVTAAAGKPHKQGFDTPESVVVTAAYAEDFIATSASTMRQ
jgi:predicted dehydrogenase